MKTGSTCRDERGVKIRDLAIRITEEHGEKAAAEARQRSENFRRMGDGTNALLWDEVTAFLHTSRAAGSK